MLFAACIVIALSLFCAYQAYNAGYWRFNYPPVQVYPVRGLDVSHHQGRIDWAKIDTARYRFVFIKSTEGGDFKDRLFVENWAGAQSQGLLVGAYHFFTLCRSGRDQADNFIDSVPQGGESMPPVIDLEFVGNCSARPEKLKFLKDLDVFSAKVREHYGQDPILYTTYNFYQTYLAGTPYADDDIWIRNVWNEPKGEWAGWAVWQYADNARVEGIKGGVDLNFMREDFYEMLRSASR